MKLIMAIINDADNDLVSKKLTDERYRVTFIASTGGFFRSGRSTLIIGVDDDRVEKALQLIKENTTVLTMRKKNGQPFLCWMLKALVSSDIFKSYKLI